MKRVDQDLAQRNDSRTGVMMLSSLTAVVVAGVTFAGLTRGTTEREVPVVAPTASLDYMRLSKNPICLS